MDNKPTDPTKRNERNSKEHTKRIPRRISAPTSENEDYRNDDNMDDNTQNAQEYEDYENDGYDDNEGGYRKTPRNKKMNYTIFMIATISVAVFASVFLFVMMFNQFSNNPPSSEVIETPSPLLTPPPQAGDEPETNFLIGLIRQMSMDSRRMDLHIIETGENRSFFVEGATSMRDRFGNSMSFPEFSVGDVVEITHKDNTNTLDSVRISAQVVSYRNVHDVSVDLDNRTLMIGNRRFPVTSETIIQYQGSPARIEDLDPVDIVSVDVFADQVMMVNIHRGHGFLQFPSEHGIIGGTIEINTGIFTALAEDGTEIKIPEGEHRITINGRNIESLILNVTVTRSQATMVSMQDIEFSTGILVVNVTPQDATLTVDGQAHPIGQQISLEYGNYAIHVEAEGFHPFEREVAVGSQGIIVNVELEEIINRRNIIITTNPPDVRIYIEGEFVGISPIQAEFTFGVHQIVVAREGYEGGPVTITVTEDSRHPHIELLPIIQQFPTFPPMPPIIEENDDDDFD
ncbi:MAG: PEGA domain-containing protein [Defluviitaleaceae bacterium]|nr:PEGA domain-containing protein [Defluviitaleaceae bacterium]